MRYCGFQRKAAEALERKKAAILEAKKARCEALARKAEKLALVRTRAAREAQLFKQKRNEELQREKKEEREAADAAALSASHWLMEKKAKQLAVQEALKQEQIERQITQEYAQGTKRAAERSVREQLIRGMERMALAAQRRRLLEGEAHRVASQRDKEQRAAAREAQFQAKAAQIRTQENAFKEERAAAETFLKEEEERKKQMVAARRLQEGQLLQTKIVLRHSN